MLATCLTSLAAIGLAATPVPAVDAGGVATESIIETSPDASLRMTVPVTIEGSGPHRFVVDTGSQRTVVSSQLAAQLGLTPSSIEILVSVLDRQPVAIVDVPQLRIGTNRAIRLRAPVLLARHIGADGILGLDSLGDKQVEIQNFGKCLKVSDGDADSSENDEGEKIRVSARQKAGQLIVLGAEATGYPVYSVLDTGAEVNVGNTRLLKLLRSRGGVEIVASREITAVTGTTRTAQIGYIREITIGNVLLRNLAVAFIDSPALEQLGLVDKPTLIMGMNSLASFERVLIDFPSRQITFVTPSARINPRSINFSRRFGG